MSNQKILISYFTHSGVTKKIVSRINQFIQTEVVEIKTVKNYSKDYNTVVKEAKEELLKHERPDIATKIPDMKDYDILIVGFPNWWGTCPMAVLSFLKQCQLSGKKIYPFVTHGGGGCGRSTADIKAECPHAEVAESFDMIVVSDAQIKAWLDAMEIANA